MRQALRLFGTLGLALLLGAPALAERPAGGRVAIIIDDVGYAREVGRQLIDLPGALTFSVLPHSPHGPQLARRAHEAGKEVMLHAPMQNLADLKLGPGGLTTDMSRPRLLGELVKGMASVPYCRGINNHMGSLLTQHRQQMAWVMAELRLQDMYFIDSKTTADSVAWRMAEEAGLRYAIRDVFLDHERDSDAIAAAFQKLIRVAGRQGRAIAIGHPYPETLAMLRRQLPGLQAAGIELVSASALAAPNYYALVGPGRESQLAHNLEAVN